MEEQNSLIRQLEDAYRNMAEHYRSCIGYADGVHALRAFFRDEPPWQAQDGEDSHFNDLVYFILVGKATIYELERKLRQEFKNSPAPERASYEMMLDMGHKLPPTEPKL